MKKYVKILENSEMIDKLQCSDYLLSGKRQILISILTNPDIDINEKLFNKYCDDYIESYIYSEECRSFLQAQYIDPFFDGYKEWSLEYLSSKLTILVDEANLTDRNIQSLKGNFVEVGGVL